MEINSEDVSDGLVDLLSRIQDGEEIIIKQGGKRVAKLMAEKENAITFSELSEFRKTILIRGKPLSQTIIDMRESERY